MRHDGAAHFYGLAAALGAIAGSRSATAPAAMSAALARGGPDDDPLVELAVRLRPVLYTFALLEMAADKLPFMPARTSPPALLGRVALGTASGVLAARAYGRSPLLGGLLAAGVALSATFAWFHLRRLLMEDLGMDGLASGLVEDAAIATAAAALVRQA
jgi:uncharacterized membrane protein